MTLISGFIRPLPDGPWLLRDCEGGVGAVRMLSNCLARSLLSVGTVALSVGPACASSADRTALEKEYTIMGSPRQDMVTITSLCTARLGRGAVDCAAWGPHPELTRGGGRSCGHEEKQRGGRREQRQRGNSPGWAGREPLTPIARASLN